MENPLELLKSAYSDLHHAHKHAVGDPNQHSLLGSIKERIGKVIGMAEGPGAPGEAEQPAPPAGDPPAGTDAP